MGKIINLDTATKQILDQVKIAILIIDPQTGNIRYANPSACDFYGYSADQFLAMNIGQINPRSLTEILKNLQNAYSGRNDYYSSMHQTATGENRYVGIYTGPFDSGNEQLLIVLIHDDSANKEADDRLRSLSQAVEQSPATIVITDRKGKIEYANPEFTQTTGYLVEEALGKDPAILKTGEGNRKEIGEMWQTILSGKTWRGEFCNRKKNGDIYWESASISPVFSEEGVITKFVAVKEDITEKKQMIGKMEESLRLNQAILDRSPIGIIIYKASGECIHVNPAARIIVGIPTEILLNQNFRDLDTWKESGLFDIAVEAIEKGETISSELSYVSTKGKELWLYSVCTPFQAGEETHLMYMFEDITTRKRSETELKKTSDELALYVKRLEERDREATGLREMSETLQVCNHLNEALDVVKNFGERLFPDSNGTVFLSDQTQHMVESVCFWGSELSGEPIFTYDECWALRRNQIHVVESISKDLLCGHMPRMFDGSYVGFPMVVSGEMIGLLHIEWPEKHQIDLETREFIQNVGELISLSISNIRLRETLRNQSIRDPLTGVFNRRFMEETLEREIPRATRKNANIGIMMMDIDHFKKFNDTYGHEAGDVVLQKVTRLVQSVIRKEDILCRYGGEEFIVILPDANQEITLQRAEKIRQEISGLNLEYDKQSLGSITISIGVANFPENGSLGDDVIQAADKALYRAKEGGRNRVCAA